MLSRRQLREGGLSSYAIEYRSRVGRLHLIHRGVYAVGYVSLSPLTRASAAVLACGPGAVLSHGSAAALWELSRWTAGPVEVSVAQARLCHGIRAHRSRTMSPSDVTVHFGIPVTTPARTVLDLGPRLDDRALARAVNEARLRWGMSPDDLAEQIDRSRGRATSRVRAFADRPSAPTRSTFEDVFLVFAKRHGLPSPEVNQRVAGHEVDMLWRPQRLVVELDGRRHHDGDPAFETDRDRDADLLAAGFRVLRVTWLRLTHEPDREAARLARVLRRRG